MIVKKITCQLVCIGCQPGLFEAVFLLLMVESRRQNRASLAELSGLGLNSELSLLSLSLSTHYSPN